MQPHERSNQVAAAGPVPPSVLNQDPHDQDDGAPTPRDIQRFIERRRARELGYELPLNTREAALYVGLHYKTVERMARDGQIPAHPASGVRRHTWKFYASELDAWLRGRVSSQRHPCSPNGKDIVQ
jgi:excisionase family DNA binding protein